MNEHRLEQLKSRLDAIPDPKHTGGIPLKLQLPSRVIEHASTIAAFTAIEVDQVYIEAVKLESYRRLAICNDLGSLVLNNKNGNFMKTPLPVIDPAPPHTYGEAHVRMPIETFRLGHFALQEYGGKFERLVEDGVCMTRFMLASDMNELAVIPKVQIPAQKPRLPESALRHPLPFDVTIDVPVSNQ